MGQKSLAALQILKILKNYSDKEHRMTQKQIADYLEKEYDIIIERKAIARHLENLTAAGYPIEQTPKGAYLEDEREFDDSELRLLIDSVLFSKHISENYAKRLIDKLQKLGSVDLRRTHGMIYRANQIQRVQSKELFYTIEMIGEAIGQGKKIQFVYNEYHLDKKLYPVSETPIKIIPYQLVVTYGHYYVIGKPETRESVESFRLERITGIEVLNEACNVSRSSFDPAKYIAEHPYLYPDAKVEVKLKMYSKLAGELIDAFGDDFKVLDENGCEATILLQAGFSDMLDWAQRFAEEVEILSPQEMRDRIRNTVSKRRESYLINREDQYKEALKKATPRSCKLSLKRVSVHGKIEKEKLPVNLSQVEFYETDLIDLSFLKKFYSLKELHIVCSPVADTSSISEFSMLEKLDLRTTNITSIDFLRGMKLKALTLADNHITDYSPLYEMNGLKYLETDDETFRYVDVDLLRARYPDIEIVMNNDLPWTYEKQYGVKGRHAFNGSAKGEYPYNLLAKVFWADEVRLTGNEAELNHTLVGLYEQYLAKEDIVFLIRYFDQKETICQIAQKDGLMPQAVLIRLGNAIHDLTEYYVRIMMSFYVEFINENKDWDFRQNIYPEI